MSLGCATRTNQQAYQRRFRSKKKVDFLFAGRRSGAAVWHLADRPDGDGRLWLEPLRPPHAPHGATVVFVSSISFPLLVGQLRPMCLALDGLAGWCHSCLPFGLAPNLFGAYVGTIVMVCNSQPIAFYELNFVQNSVVEPGRRRERGGT